jgi:aryl-alcohol dehydrogenase-like predicted oxidoreductase
LSGKLRRNRPVPSEVRISRTVAAAPPVPDELLYRVTDAMDVVARETGKSIPQIAINWLLQRPSVSSVIIGARTSEQLQENIGALGWTLSAEQVSALDAASACTPPYPYWHQLEFVERNPFPTVKRPG